jgi:hypothetical protein
MRDFARLREHLRVALACAPLVAGACSKGAQQPKQTAKPPDAAALEQGVIGPGPGPRCPSGKWCGDVDSAKTIAEKDATTKLGCPTSLWSSGGFPDGQESRMGVAATLDEKATQAKRDANDQKPCCYDWGSPCPGGRPLLHEGRAIVARAVRGDAWSGSRARSDRFLRRFHARLRTTS